MRKLPGVFHVWGCGCVEQVRWVSNLLLVRLVGLVRLTGLQSQSGHWTARSMAVMSPSQRSVSVGHLPDLARPLCRQQVTHVSCDNLRPQSWRRAPPPPPPVRVSSLQRAPSQALMHYTTVPQSLVTRSLGSRHQPTRSSLRHSRMLVLIKQGRGKHLSEVLGRRMPSEN